MAKPTPNAPPDKLVLYEALVATIAGLPRKGAKNPYTSINGHMFSFLDSDGTLSLRLPKDQREAFLIEHQTTLSVQYNTVMKEYVLVPAAMLQNAATITGYFAASYAYVAALKPKSTKPKK